MSGAVGVRLGLWLCVVVCVVVGWLPADATAADHRFGVDAGYVWPGVVTSVAGTWQVPRILGHGQASTWIGAQGRLGASDPFVQVGVVEVGAFDGFAPQCNAFWSDGQINGLPDPIELVVRSGDWVTARMTSTPSGWNISFRDDTTKQASPPITSTDGLGLQFNYAEWIQEHPAGTHYPRLSAFAFRRLEVNGTAPAPAQLWPAWISLPGNVDIAPTAVADKSFTVHRAHLSKAGAQYLADASSVNASGKAFASEVQSWTPSTPATQVAAAADRYAAASETFARKLRRQHWPRRARASIRSLLAAERMLVRCLRQLAGSPPADRLSLLTTTGSLVSAAILRVSDALPVPYLQPR